MDPEFDKAYHNDTVVRAYIKDFRSLNGQKPNDMEVRHHPDFQKDSRTHDGHFLFVDSREEMVQKDQQGIKLPANATKYYWFDV